MTNSIAPWQASTSQVVSDNSTNVPAIVEAALQLRKREREQVVQNLEGGNYEVVTSFIWLKTMSLLKKQLASLGAEFISELLQRPDLVYIPDISTAISDLDAISLARDLGIVGTATAMRLTHSQEIITHFSSVDEDEDDLDSRMTPEDAIGCLRTCVQSVLGHAHLSVAEDFAEFRSRLSDETLDTNSPAVIKLQQSPYFFVKTALGSLLGILKTSNGASLEHASRNALLLVPMFWKGLKAPEKWQVGQAYASEFAEGRKESAKALYNVLLATKGFDFVPENLRSNTFIQAASAVVAAHQGSNNFYNEPAPMRELARLGSSIPGPAVAACIQAILCVKLGNMYNVSWAAQPAADELISSVSRDRWAYYLDGRLEEDRIVLPKLSYDKPYDNWASLVKSLDFQSLEIDSKNVRELVDATARGQKVKARAIAHAMYLAAYG